MNESILFRDQTPVKMLAERLAQCPEVTDTTRAMKEKRLSENLFTGPVFSGEIKLKVKQGSGLGEILGNFIKYGKKTLYHSSWAART